MSHKLSVGDRVKLIKLDEHFRRPLGSRGTIVEIVEDTFWPYHVRWDSDKFSTSWARRHLEKLNALDCMVEAISAKVESVVPQ